MKHVFLYLILFTFFSCNKLVEVPMPSDRLEGAAVFTSDASALSAIAGLYTQMIRANMQLSSSAVTIYAGMSADELYNTTSVATTDEYFLNNLSAGNGTLRSNLWIPAYQLIYQANSIIDGLEASSGVSQPVKHQLEGEAKFIRAFSHFYLVNLFGDVPLITSTDYRETSVVARTPRDEVYKKIIDDLKDAKQLMTNVYPSAGRVRPNSRAASALLARVYLYRGEWLNAETEASLVIGDPTYNLTGNLNNVFLSASPETIWQLMPTSTTTNTWEGNIFIPAGTSLPTYGLSSTMTSAFSATDARKTNWTKSVTIAGNTHYYPFKYKVKTATALTEYYVVLRLAEQYLIRSEARTHLNKVAEAKTDVNMIRTRAALPNTSATDATSLLAAIEKERQLELFAEWGHRWFDLKRTGRVNAVLSVKTGWNATDTLYPIPQPEINRNSLLTQNAGY